jgi:hypothetical protein
MKKEILILIFGLIGFGIRSQNIDPLCPVKGMTTNPGNAINLENPSYENNTFFDWGAEEFDINSSKFPSSQTTIKSPFSPNAQNFNVVGLSESEDYKPEDGWELLSWDLGYDYDGLPNSSPTGVVHFILYNKLTSTMRVFAAGEGLQAYNSAVITFHTQTIFGSLTSYQPSLIQDPVSFTGLDKHYSKEVQSVSEFYQIANNWIYADFFINYDPCVCLYDSKMFYNVEYVNTADLEISGAITGTIAAASSGVASDVKSGTSFSLDKVVEGFNKYKGYYDKSKDLYGIIGKIDGVLANRDSVVYLPAFNSVTNNTWGSYWGLEPSEIFEEQYGVLHESTIQVDDLFETGLKLIPYVSEAYKIMKFFVDATTTTATPSSVKANPMVIDANVRLTGDITEVHSYANIIKNVPGSLNSVVQDQQYPLYNEVLGVFNLIETPQIIISRSQSVAQGDEFGLAYETNYNSNYTAGTANKTIIVNEREEFQLSTNELKYTINPVLGVADEDIQIMGLIRYEIPLSNESTFKQIKVGIYETELRPLNCLFNSSFLYGGQKEITFEQDFIAENFHYRFEGLPRITNELVDYEVGHGFRLPQDYTDYQITGLGNNFYNGNYFFQNDTYSAFFDYERVYNISLKLFIIVKLPNGEIAEYIHTYDLDQITGVITKPGAHAQAKPFIQVDNLVDLNLSAGEMLAENIVIAENVNIGTNGTDVFTFKAYEQILVKPGVELNPNIVLEIVPREGCYALPQNVMLSGDEVSTFCNSNAYTGIRTKSGVEEPVSEEVLVNNFEFSMYPNPTNSNTWLSYSIEKNAMVSIEVTDLSGKMVEKSGEQFQSVGDYKLMLQTEELGAGIYLCTVRIDGVAKTKRLIIQ